MISIQPFLSSTRKLESPKSNFEYDNKITTSHTVYSVPYILRACFKTTRATSADA